MSLIKDKSDGLRLVRKGLASGNILNCIEILRETANPADDAVLQTHYSRLALELNARIDNFPSIRIAFLANATLAHWVGCLRFWLLLEGYRLEEYIAPYGTWRQEIIDGDSGLYRFNPDVVWLFLQRNDVNFDVGMLSLEATSSIVDDNVKDIALQASNILNRLQALLLVNNLVPPVDRIFGNFEGGTTGSYASTINQFNLSIIKILPKGSVIFDIAHIAAKFGLERWEDARLWYYSKHPFSFEAQGSVAFVAARLLASSRGHAKKCIVLDLDNTLWGGVIGDDGLDGIKVGSDGGAVGDAYARFQTWLKALAARGVTLAVCSKNNEDNAREPFLKKSGMVLQLDDFAAFKANWRNKADNIREIAKELNLGLDSFVFIDDNPAERALIRSELNAVSVPEMPSDPADFIRVLSADCWFETLAVSQEDWLRTKAYRDNAARNQAESSATDIHAYLSSLEMQAKWGAVNNSTLQRATQLVNKTNQFNLTTIRYTESQLAKLAQAKDAWVGHFSLDDRFGAHGLIAVVILRFDHKNAYIDTWVMSCRVFSRKMEDFTFKIISEVAKKYGCKNIIGKYLPSPKNAIVADLYHNFGGSKTSQADTPGETWLFELDGRELLGSKFIQDISNLNPNI